MNAPDKAAKNHERRNFELSLKFGGITVTINGLGGVVTILAIALVGAAVRAYSETGILCVGGTGKE